MTLGTSGPTTRWRYANSGDLDCQILATSAATTCAGAPASSKYSYSYTTSHLIASVTDPNGSTVTYDYFGASDGSKYGLLKSETSQTGLKTTYDYNAYLQRTTMVTPQGNAAGASPATYTWNYRFDDVGRLTSYWDPFGSQAVPTIAYGYDAEGNLISEIDADGHGSFKGYFPGGLPCYDARGASGTCGTPPAEGTSYTYDADANLGSVRHTSLQSDGLDRLTALTYHPNGEVASVANPIGTWSFSATSYGAQTSTMTETPPTGDIVTRTYDPMGRLTLEQYAPSTKPQIDTAPDLAFAYDDAGNLCKVKKASASITCATSGGIAYAYDSLNRLSGADGFGYSYDGLNLLQRTFPGGTKKVSYAYDGDHRICAINMSGTVPSCSSGDVRYVYDLAAATATITETSNAGKNSSVTTLDKAGRVTKLVNKYNTSTTSSSYNLTLSSAGYPASVAVTNNGLPTNFKTETQTYQFNTAGRLTQICYDGTTSGNCGTSTKIMTGVKYTYDVAGNVTRRQTFGVGAGNTYYGYSAADQACWYGSTSGTATTCTAPSGNSPILYNNLGDRKSIGGVNNTIRYDQAHRMTSATVAGTASVYTYDAAGNRATEKVGTAAQTSFLWDPNAQLPQLASTTKSTTTTDYYYGAGLEASKVGTATSYYQLDQIGSIANVISGTAIAASGSYQPYGVPRQGTPGVFGFDAEYRDGSTGFVNLRARMYDPATANFLQPDPAGRTPDYSFGAGNPVMFADPSGMFSWGKVLDWFNEFNEHLNPGYFYLESCFGSEGTESVGSYLVGCTVGATALATVAVSAAKPIAGALAAPETGDTVSLFRSVSDAELADIRASGGFRTTPGHIEGKWFADSAVDAQTWGARLGNTTVVRVDVPRAFADELWYAAKQDWIGSARFADPQQLARLNQLMSNVRVVG